MNQIDDIMDKIARLVEEASGGRSIDPQGSITLATIRRDIELIASIPELRSRPKLTLPKLEKLNE